MITLRLSIKLLMFLLLGTALALAESVTKPMPYSFPEIPEVQNPGPKGLRERAVNLW